MGIPVRNVLLTNLTLKVTAFIVATVLWYIVSQSRIVHQTVHIPVCFYNTVENTLINAPETVAITIAGTRQDMLSLDTKNCGIHIDASKLTQAMNHLPITDQNLFLPHNICMVQCKPLYVEVILNNA
jgi:hypothetical protein